MKVYILVWEEYEDSGIGGVFDNEEAAKTFCDAVNQYSDFNYEVIEYDVDTEAPAVFPKHVVTIGDFGDERAEVDYHVGEPLETSVINDGRWVQAEGSDLDDCWIAARTRWAELQKAWAESKAAGG